MVSLLGPSTSWVVELEGPEEVVDLLEFGTETIDLVDDVLNAFDSMLTESLLNDFILDKWDSLSVEFSESSLVNELLDSTLGWESISNVWLNLSKHIH